MKLYDIYCWNTFTECEVDETLKLSPPVASVKAENEALNEEDVEYA